MERLSKNCSICTGALSIKHSDPTKYLEIKNRHKCEINHSGSSGIIPFRNFYFNYMLLRFHGGRRNISFIFTIRENVQRSIYKVNKTISFSFLYIIRCSYIGDGDSKAFSKLTNNPPYKNVSINKIEDVNHFSKKMLHRLQKIAEDLKKTKIDGKFGILGKGRMTKRK